MQHVGVGDHNIAVQPYCTPRIRWRIAVKRVGPHAQIGSTIEFEQLSDLVL